MSHSSKIILRYSQYKSTIDTYLSLPEFQKSKAPGRVFTSSSFYAALDSDPALELSYITAPPRMTRYMAVSSSIYGIYLKYIAPEDIIVYSIDEVFIDVTDYLNLYHMTAHELAMTMIREVLYTTGITVTAGIGTNLYLAKVAMDIVAKHVPADKDGVRIAELDERRYRELLWTHEPLTDFWHVGRSYAKKPQESGMSTMGDVARCSIGGPHDYCNEDLLYKLFGINAELLIDHTPGARSRPRSQTSRHTDRKATADGQSICINMIVEVNCELFRNMDFI